MKLPKAEQNLGEWQAAIECLILVAEKNGPTMMARIGMMKALNRHVVREFNPDRKDSNQDPKRSWHWIEVLILSLAHVGLRRGQRGEGHSFHVSAMGHLVRSLEGQQS